MLIFKSLIKRKKFSVTTAALVRVSQSLAAGEDSENPMGVKRLPSPAFRK
jgi:hypothetical protein